MLNAAGESVTVEPIAFDDLGEDEILVRLEASGVCHTDLHVKVTSESADVPRIAHTPGEIRDRFRANLLRA